MNDVWLYFITPQSLVDDMELSTDLIQSKSDEYSYDPFEEEAELLEILPSRFEEGQAGMEDVLRIVRWKSQRSTGHFQKNDPEFVDHILAIVLADIPVTWRMKHLCLLDGVQPRVASAILMFVDPNSYTVMDYRAWTVLHDIGELPPPPTTYTAADYEEYLIVCRRLGDRYSVDLRTLDRALFQLYDDLPA